LPALLDTDVVVHLRDGSEHVWQLVRSLEPPLALSIISRVELENGIYRDPADAALRRVALDTILSQVETLDFGRPELRTYRDIVAAIGYSKRKVIDRMIAATALVHGLTVVTLNGADYRDIPGLAIDVWKNVPFEM
jgi:predicted nucleic acid-binding protein